MIDNNTIRNIEELLLEEKTSTLLLDSVKELKYEKKSKYQYLICAILSVIVSLYSIFNVETVSIMRFAVDTILGIQISFIAVVISAYSIFQALLSDGFIMALIKTENNLLKISNKSFLNLTICYLIAIGSNVVLGIILKGTENGWVMCSKMAVNLIMSGLLCLVYFFTNFLLISEICNFALNLYRMFNAANSERIVSIIEKENEKQV